MEDNGIYDLFDKEQRTKFLKLDVDVTEQSFSIRNEKEVLLFSNLLGDYVEEEYGIDFHLIDLPRWYMYSKHPGVDARLFAAIYDLKITLIFLLIDLRKASPDFNSMNRKDATDILSDTILFRKKMKALHESIDLALRLRAFFDKFMGIIILLYEAENYESFIKSTSRRKWFQRHMVDYIGSENMEQLVNDIKGLDDKYRTAEAHQAGKMRKWVLSTQDYYLDNMIDFVAYTNVVISYASWLDGLLDVTE